MGAGRRVTPNGLWVTAINFGEFPRGGADTPPNVNPPAVVYTSAVRKVKLIRLLP